MRMDQISQHGPRANRRELVDITDAATLAHLLKYDSVHGNLEEKVSVRGSSITVGPSFLRSRKPQV